MAEKLYAFDIKKAFPNILEICDFFFFFFFFLIFFFQKHDFVRLVCSPLPFKLR